MWGGARRRREKTRHRFGVAHPSSPLHPHPGPRDPLRSSLAVSLSVKRGDDEPAQTLLGIRDGGEDCQSLPGTEGAPDRTMCLLLPGGTGEPPRVFEGGSDLARLRFRSPVGQHGREGRVGTSGRLLAKGWVSGLCGSRVAVSCERRQTHVHPSDTSREVRQERPAGCRGPGARHC